MSVYRYTGEVFEPYGQHQPTAILSAESFRWWNQTAHNSDLELHRQRFCASTALMAPEFTETAGSEHLWASTKKILDGAPGPSFPRLAVEEHGQYQALILRVRPAPKQRSETTLTIGSLPDPRVAPTAKGPDIQRLAEFKNQFPATDDAVLHDNTHIQEATTGGLVIWRGNTLVVPQHPDQLFSTTSYSVQRRAQQQGITIEHRPVTVKEFATGDHPVFFLNALHGVSEVPWVVYQGTQYTKQRHPAASQWQRWWRESFEVF